MQKTMFKTKVLLVILLVSVFLAVLPMQPRSATVLQMLLRNESPATPTITIALPSFVTGVGEGTPLPPVAEWVTPPAAMGAYAGDYSAYLEVNCTADPFEHADVSIPFNMRFGDIEDFSFAYYSVSGSDYSPHICFYTKDEEGHTADITMMTNDNATRDEWQIVTLDTIDWFAAAPDPTIGRGKFHYFGNATELDAETQGPMGAKDLSHWQSLIGDYTVYKIQVEEGWWNTGTGEAYVDDVTINGILIALEPYKGPVGTDVIVAGSGATPEGTVEIYWDVKEDWDETTHKGKLDEVSAESDGLFEVEITVPECPSDDTHSILAYDVSAHEVDSASYTIIPKIVVSPDTGVPGETVEVEGTGFSKRSDVDIYFDEDGDWPVIDADELVATAETNKFGSFPPEEFHVPDVATDDYEVWAIDEEDYSAKDLFTVKGFYVIVDPDEGPPGIEVRVRGTLSADSEVDVKFGRDWNGEAPPDDDWDWSTYVLEDVETDEDGFFDDTFEVPSVSAGTYTVMAIDEEDEWATDEFEVKRAPRIELTPDSGEPGDEITIEGWYFTGDSEITLTFNGEDVTPEDGITTDEDGSFEAEFEVPDVPDGDYTVTAEDEEELSAEADFEVVTPPAPPAVLTVEIHPETLNLKSNGRWITCLIRPPAGYDVEDIDVDTVVLCYGDEEVEVDRWNIEGNALMVKFDRSEVAEILAGAENEEVELTIKAKVNGKTFEGSDTIRVISPGKGKGPKS